jgi:hypothetical protein
LRHTNIIPADRAFYEAGLHCRDAKKNDMSLVFMNRFLDLVEAIENDDGMLDPEGFEETEIPMEVPLPGEVRQSLKFYFSKISDDIFFLKMDFSTLRSNFLYYIHHDARVT